MDQAKQTVAFSIIHFHTVCFITDNNSVDVAHLTTVSWLGRQRGEWLTCKCILL